MDNQPSINRELLIPILLGGLSVVGITVVLLIGRSLNSPAEIDVTPSTTSLQYIYLGTEPAITTLVVEGSELPPTGEPVGPPPIILPSPNTTPTATSAVSRTNTPNRTPISTSTNSTAAAANTYDDTDSRLAYSGSWVSQTGVDDAYQDTLHISSAVGNSVTFTFTGPEIHVFYQAGPSLGSITITIDSFGEPEISQAQSTTQIKEWVSDTLSSGTHRVDIAHAGGGSINIDRFYIPAPTPTPTRTPTP